MSPELLWGVVGAIFGGGIFYATTRAEIASIKRDINGIGTRLRDSDEKAGRRYHNISLAMVVVAPLEKEKEVGDYLRE
jgi:hypothetical protein